MTQFILRRHAKVEAARLLRAELLYRWRALISGPHFRRRQYTSPLCRQSDTRSALTTLPGPVADRRLIVADLLKLTSAKSALGPAHLAFPITSRQTILVGTRECRPRETGDLNPPRARRRYPPDQRHLLSGRKDFRIILKPVAGRNFDDLDDRVPGLPSRSQLHNPLRPVAPPTIAERECGLASRRD